MKVRQNIKPAVSKLVSSCNRIKTEKKDGRPPCHVGNLNILRQVRQLMGEMVSPPQLSLYPTSGSLRDWQAAGVKAGSIISMFFVNIHLFMFYYLNFFKLTYLM
jgi:hypothetical protein